MLIIIAVQVCVLMVLHLSLRLALFSCEVLCRNFGGLSFTSLPVGIFDKLTNLTYLYVV